MSGDDKDMENSDVPEEFFEEESFDEVDAGDAEAEDWESYDGEFVTDEGEAPNPLKEKKKTPLNLVVIGGALFVGLLILIVTVANNKPAAKVEDMATAGELPGVADQPKFNSAVEPVKAPKPTEGFLNDPSALKNLTANVNKASAEKPSAVPEMDPGAAPVAAVQPPPAAPPVNDALTPMPEPMPAPVASPAATESTPVAAAPAPDNSPSNAHGGFTVAPIMPAPAANASDPALEAKLDQLIDRVAAMETKLTEAQKQPESNVLATVQQTLIQINSRLDRLEAQGSATPAAQSAEDVTPAVQQSAVQPVVHKASPPVSSHKAVRTKSTQEGSEASTVRWILKSAQPGQAYVSRPGQNDMISVHVGDTLPGIGRVTAIEAPGGHWVIQGTQSSITQ